MYTHAYRAAITRGKYSLMASVFNYQPDIAFSCKLNTRNNILGP